MNTKTKGVLLMAYGSPETLEDVEAYFTDIRGGVKPKEEILHGLQERYRAVGGRTPLNEVTRAEAAALQRLLDLEQTGAYAVAVGMKHWHPAIAKTLANFASQGIGEILAIALAPHYSTISIGGYQKKIDEALYLHGFPLNIHLVQSWHTEEKLIACIAEQLQEALLQYDTSSKDSMILFTAHSLPEYILEHDDPYQEQLLETANAVAKRAHISAWRFAFQSAGKSGGTWLGPDINDSIKTICREGWKKILVCPIGFVADNLEIVYDIDIEAQDTARDLGVLLWRTPSRNIHPLFIGGLADIVRREMPC